MDTRERIVAFIPDYGAYLVNRLHLGEDGISPYKRLKGKKAEVWGLDFGE